MASRDNNRRSEAALALSVWFLLVCTLAFVYRGKRLESPSGALYINEVTPEQFAQALHLETPFAERFANYRTQHGGFVSADQLLDAPLFTPAEADRIADVLESSHLNPATTPAPQLAATLNLPPPVAQRLAQEAQAVQRLAPSAQRPAPNSQRRFLRRVTLLDSAEVRSVRGRFLVRRPEQVARRFGIGCALLLGMVFLLPPWLRVRLGGDPYLLPLTLLLTGLGVVTLYSVKDPLRDGLAYENHLWGLAISLVVMIALARLAPAARARLRNYQYVWAIAAMLLVAALALFGSGPEGVRLRVFGFQPVELIKLFLVFFLAAYLSERADLIADTTRRFARADEARPRANALPRLQDIGPMAVMFALALLLFFVIRDLGPGVLLFATFITLLYLATGRGGFVLVGVLLLTAGGYIAYQAKVGVFPTRVEMWLNPFHNAHPNGLQLGQAYWALSSGGVEGSGLGLGMPALIPRAGSDLAFVSWVEETGMVGAWLALTVYVVLVWRGLHIALRAASDFDRMLAFGLTALLGIQALLILGGATGVLPLSGLSLPFLSYGNSSLVASFAIIGLLRGISAPPPGGVGRPAPRPETLRATRRFAFAFTVCLLGVVGVVRLGAVQMVQANALAVRPVTTPDADGVARPHYNPRLLAMAKEIERGSIYDRNGRALATSRPKEIAKAIANSAQAQQQIDSGRRYYPFGPACAHLVGYLDASVGGPSGMESGYDVELRGYRRYAELLPDYRRRNMPGYRPRRSKDLVLTVDAVLQRDVQALLWKTVSQLSDKRNIGQTTRVYVKDRAAFVLYAPNSGDVLVAATLPTFDPNTLTPEQVQKFLHAPDALEEARFVNRAVAGVYPPGSTLKIATAACALDNLPNALRFSVPCNQIDEEIKWQANGMTYVRRNTRDDKGDPNFGVLEMTPAFRVSSNIYFANLATAMDSNVFRATLSEKMGFRYTPKQKFFDADLPDIGYGQGRMLATPVEMARLAASVAADGKMWRPRYVSSLRDAIDTKQKKVFAPVAMGQAMKPQTAATLRTLMRSVVTGGTASGVFYELAFPVAGKTGTAQNERGDREPHSWFVGFAPAEETATNSGQISASRRRTPLAFACVVENGGYGKKVAAVICRDVLKRVMGGR